MPVLRPVHDRLLVKRDEPEKVSVGGIVIPDASVDERTTRGTVMAVGPGKYSEKTAILIPMTVKVGDKILFHPAAGSKVTIGSESYWCLPESDAWCVIDPDEPEAKIDVVIE
jgi:chaperonin GroES